MAFDGITTKAIVDELQNIIGSKIDKIHEPDKNTIILGLYLNGKKYALNICIDSHNCRINLTTHSLPRTGVHSYANKLQAPVLYLASNFDPRGDEVFQQPLLEP